MNIKKVDEFDALAFTDITGTVRILHGCPLTKLEEFAAVRSLLWREIASASLGDSGNITVQQLYHSNSFFAQMCLRALELCGVSPDWVDLNMAAQLLFPFTWEGKSTEGLLVQLNFPSQPAADQDAGSGEAKKAATWDEMLASLWGATDSLETARELAENMPWRKLHSVIEARGEQVFEARKKAGGLTKAEEEDAIAKSYADYVAKKKAEDSNGATPAVKSDSVESDRFSVGSDDPFNDPSQWAER